jgi:hypothetical protein
MFKKGIFGCIAVAFAALITACAGWGGPVCSIVDLADKACPLVVQFTDEAGTKQQLQITENDAKELGAKKAAMAHTSQDAGK